MTYAVFQRLCSALEVRNDSPADRDRELYRKVCSGLKMENRKPKDFFEANPAVTEVDVLGAFLDTFEPFATMVEAIFDLCSNAPKGASGGSDLQIGYDVSAEALRFDLDAFRRFESVRQLVQVRGTVPRYHSDFVPVFGFTFKQTRDGTFHAPPSKSVEPIPSAKDFDQLFAKAVQIGQAHTNVLNEFFAFVATHPDVNVPAWFQARGIVGDYIPPTIDRVESWRRNIADGASALQGLRGEYVVDNIPDSSLRHLYDRIDRTLNEIADFRDESGWRDVVEQWLQLPFWKKRWQVYEVWIACCWLTGLIEAGGTLNIGIDGQIILHTGSTGKPLGVVRLTQTTAIEVWMEFRLTTTGAELRPDLVVTIRHDKIRVPILFMECKQRAGVTVDSMWRDASKYLQYLPPSSEHFVVNYDSYEGAQKRKRAAGDRELLALGDVRPGGNGLPVLRDAIARTFGRDSVLLVLLLDTTGSMDSKLPAVASTSEHYKPHRRVCYPRLFYSSRTGIIMTCTL